MQKIFFLLCIVLLMYGRLQCVTLVYSFRFAEITRPQLVQARETEVAAIGQKPSYTDAVTFFDRSTKSAENNKFSTTGAIGTFLYYHTLSYFRIDGAFGRVGQKLVDGSCFSQVQTDDLLFTFGKGWDVTDKWNLTVSGLVGLPTHKNLGLVKIQLGTGHVGLGAQFDAAYLYSQNRHHSILTAARYVRFLPAHSTAQIGPICQRFKVNFGNLCDLYLAHFSNWGKHKVEIAYNPTFFFGASFCPFNAELESEFHFVRSSFALSYQYSFLLGKHPSALIFILSYGFEHGDRPTRRKYLVTPAISFVYNF